MKTNRLYIYCIIELNESKWGKKRNYGEEISFGKIGIDIEEVTTVSFNGLAAVVSQTGVNQFDGDGEETLKHYITRHQQVIEFIMQKYPVIPMKFGTAAEDKNEVLEMLDRAYIQFKSAFNKFRDKVELAVQVFWDEETALTEIIANNGEIQELMAQFAASENNDPDSRDGFAAVHEVTAERNEAVHEVTAERSEHIHARITIGEKIHDVISKKHDDVITNIQNYLLPYAVDFTSNKLLADDMIMNWAFLVEKQREAEFDAKVNEISDKYEDEFPFKYIGPMPPYSFVGIELTMPKFELIDRARRTLGLSEEASISEIKAAYRNLAAKYHPDKSPRPPLEKGEKFLDLPAPQSRLPVASATQTGQAGEDGEKFKKIAEAYEILEIYCANYRYSFRKEQVEDAILVIGEA